MIRTSRGYDFVDARYKGLVIWMDRDQLEEMYPDADDVIETTFAHNGDWAYDDRPDSVLWTDNRRAARARRAMPLGREADVVDGHVHAARLADGYPAQSPFKDRRGKISLRAAPAIGLHRPREPSIRHGARPDQPAGRDQQAP